VTPESRASPSRGLHGHQGGTCVVHLLLERRKPCRPPPGTRKRLGELELCRGPASPGKRVAALLWASAVGRAGEARGEGGSRRRVRGER
jgi:hypothetical protein